MSKEAHDELLEKLPMPGNCNHIEVVWLNPQMFSSIRKEVKTKDVVPLKAKKALLKGITAVTRILDDFNRCNNFKKLFLYLQKRQWYSIFKFLPI